MKFVKGIIGGIIMGVILAGMGVDGADGIKHLKEKGSITIAQNEAANIVFGMPGVCIDTGAVDLVLAPDEIRAKIIETVGLLEHNSFHTGFGAFSENRRLDADRRQGEYRRKSDRRKET